MLFLQIREQHNKNHLVLLSCVRKHNALLVEFDEKPVNAMSWASALILFLKTFFGVGNNFYCSVGGKARYFHNREKSFLSKLSLART